jgi:superfamily I DNA/RNA helicase
MPLNPSQTEAVNTCEGFQLILAGPGSGKTRVITEKILHLIDQGIPPNQILALTFSDKAASEMSERIENISPHPGLAVHTFPSFCLDILERERARERDVGPGRDHQPHYAAGPGPAEHRQSSGLRTSRWGTIRRRLCGFCRSPYTTTVFW